MTETITRTIVKCQLCGAGGLLYRAVEEMADQPNVVCPQCATRDADRIVTLTEQGRKLWEAMREKK